MASTAEVVDLITPTPSPVPPDAAMDDDDSDVEEVKPEDFVSSKARGKRKLEAAPDNALATGDADDDEEEEVAILVEPSGGPSSSGFGSSSTADEEPQEDDDDVAFLGRTGQLALSDFPHARENCQVKKFAPGKEQAKCMNCFCCTHRAHPAS